mmetsp:Transcript_657/g.1567  ORF Transcript_657/g.1567 Transcript_657/m.1567 type:complete len:164 (-) Transcript_657:563-1054(-)
MRYISTRTGERYSFQEAVQLGRATDGGMLLPETVPFVARATLQGWSHLSYPELGLKIFKLFVPASEFPHSTLEEIFLKGAFSEFGASDVVTLRDTELAVDSKTPLVHVAELWHGPTLAFKDLGMQVLAKILQAILQAKGERQVVVVVRWAAPVSPVLGSRSSP